MVYASEVSKALDVAEGYGWTINGRHFDWKTFIAAKDKEISRLSAIYETNLARAGVNLIRAKAVLEDAHTLSLSSADGRRTVTAEKILVATGGRPVKPVGLPGVEHAITSNEAFELHDLPKRVVVVGGGYIAVEFAGIFHGLGADTTLVYRGASLLRGFDGDVRRHLMGELAKRGLKVRLDVHHTALERADDGVLISRLSDGSRLESETVMFATGREPYVAGLNLERAGVALNARGAIVVDPYSRTTAENVWAVGDVTDRLNLTPVAIREGQAFAETVFNHRPTRFDHADVATAVFSQPPVACVGLTEEEARRCGAVDIYKSVFRPMKTVFVGSEEATLMKLVVDQNSGRVLGCHVVGPDGPEIVQMAAIAVKAGLTKAQWDDTCALHPTAAEEFVTMREAYAPPKALVAQ
jgi:glutathione reductase (NADPH)